MHTEVDDIPVDDDEHAMDEKTKEIANANNSSEKALEGQMFGDDEVDFNGQTSGDDELDFHGHTFGDDEVDFHGQTSCDDEVDFLGQISGDDEVDFHSEEASLPLSLDMKVMCTHMCTCTYMYLWTDRNTHIPYSGFCLRGLISAKHQFLCSAIISAIIISAKQSYYQIM